LIDKNSALFQLHFPENQDLLAKAEHRLKFEELFYIQLQLLRNNLIRKKKIKSFVFEKVGENFNTYMKNTYLLTLPMLKKKCSKKFEMTWLMGHK